MPHNQHFKSWTNWAIKFCLICPIHLTQPTTTSSSILTTFCKENASTTSVMAENAVHEFMEPQGMNFYATGVNKLICCWQKYVDCNGSYFDWASQVALVVKKPPANGGDIRDKGWIPGWGRSPGGGDGNPLQRTGEPQGQRSMAGYSPWSCKESNMTGQLNMIKMHLSLVIMI